MPVLVLVDNSSIAQNDGKCTVPAGQEFQIMIERRSGYKAAYIKVVQPDAKPKVYRIEMNASHNLCPARWVMTDRAEVLVGWLPDEKPGEIRAMCMQYAEPAEERVAQLREIKLADFETVTITN